jgi:hypothetical protein
MAAIRKGHATAETTQEFGWDDVVARFGYHGLFADTELPIDRPASDPVEELNRIANVWAPGIVLRRNTVSISCELWANNEIVDVLDRMARIWDKDHSLEDGYLTSKAPRRIGDPIILLRRKAYVILDGRRRANRLRDIKGTHKVIVLRPL